MIDALLPAWQAVLEAAVRWVPVVLLAALITRVLRGRPARDRHAAWLVALVGLAVLPFVGGRAPVGSIPAGEVLSSVRSASGISTAVVPRQPSLPMPGAAAGQVAVDSPLTSANAGGYAPSNSLVWPRRFALLWAIVASLLLVRELIAVAAAGVLSRGARRIPVEALPAALKLTARDPEVLGGGTDIPILYGLHRPRILLPSDWRSWPESWLRAVILHECAHAMRHDLAVLAAARVIRGLFWFQPAVWIVVRALQREAERATDERVLRSGMDRFEYADALLGIARRIGHRPVPVVGLPVAAAAGLRERLCRVAGADSRVTNVSLRATLAAVAPIGLAVLVAAAPITGNLRAAEWLERIPLDDGAILWQSTCPTGSSCASLTAEAVRLLREVTGGGVVAVQEVATGRVAAYAFLDRHGSQASIPAVPVSAVAGLPLAAAWWEAGMGDRHLPCPAVINLSGAGAFTNTNGLDTGRIRAPGDVITMQCATAAIAMGWYLAAERGPSYLAQAFARLGFAPPLDSDAFWTEAGVPAPTSPIVPPYMADDATWVLAGSVHGTVRTTPLHITSFLHAIANGGRAAATATPAGRAGVQVRLIDSAVAGRLLSLVMQADEQTAGSAVFGVTGAGSDADLFAGLGLDSRGTATYAVVVWLPRENGANTADHAHGARALADQLLAARR